MDRFYYVYSGIHGPHLGSRFWKLSPAEGTAPRDLLAMPKSPAPTYSKHLVQHRPST